MGRPTSQPGRHRLGTPGLVHCLHFRAVAVAFEAYRRLWWLPAKHSLAGLRRRAAAAAAELAWTPTVVHGLGRAVPHVDPVPVSRAA